MNSMGELIRGELHTADADPAIEVPIYSQGSLTARTLQSDEMIVVTSYSLVSVTGGDIYLFIGADSTAGAGEYVARGAVSATGGLLRSNTLFAGRPGHKPYAFAPAGNFDVIFEGYIQKKATLTRPTWKESINAAQ